MSNIGTATYHLSKLLAKLLFPLSESEDTNKNTNYFVEKIKKKHIPNNNLLFSFDVKPLFANLPPDEGIETILNRIYNKNEISTVVTKNKMKKLLKLYMKKCSLYI